jgi:hypothetical protein
MMGVSAVDGPISVKLDALQDEIKDLLVPTAVNQIKKLLEIGRKIDGLTSDLI